MASHGIPLVATTTDPTMISRRSAHYQPSIWNHEFVESLRRNYKGEIYTKRAEKLREDVSSMFHEVSSGSSSSTLLKFIDTVQRIGVSYHFVDEIKGALGTMMSNKHKDNAFEEDEDLSTRALRFRLLRQHGYEVSQDVFKSIKEEMMISSSCDKSDAILLKDVEGMLSLYEASFYAFESEEILDEAQKFTSRLLKEYLINEDINQYCNTIGTPKLSNFKHFVSHALEVPLHWRPPRVEARWFIDAYEKMKATDWPLLLEFAKLDFNMVQATYQEELKHLSRWWKKLGFIEIFSFARDRWVENFFWAMGLDFNPKLGNFRIELAKQLCLLTVVDDYYDIYGSLDELKLFTDVVERWDNNMVGDLPDYMRIWFLAIYNTTDELAHEISKKNGQDVIPYLKRAWADICKTYLIEAKWYYSGYTPTLEEHINNGWLSATGCFVPTFTYCLLGNETTEEALECLKNYSSNLVCWSFTILRIQNDLANSTVELKRGDTPGSIECYMNETRVSESIACKHLENLITDLWKKINKDQGFSDSTIFPKSFLDAMTNVNRMSHFYYQHGDGYSGHSNQEAKVLIASIVMEPIPYEDEIEI